MLLVLCHVLYVERCELHHFSYTQGSWLNLQGSVARYELNEAVPLESSYFGCDSWVVAGIKSFDLQRPPACLVKGSH